MLNSLLCGAARVGILSVATLVAAPSFAQDTAPSITCEAGFAGGGSGQVCQVAPLIQDGLTSTLLNDANGTAVQHSLSLGGLSNAAVLLLFDTSVGSNVGQIGGREAIMAANLASARTLVRSLPADTQYGVATFDAGKDLSLGFTTDRNAVTAALDPSNISPTGLNTFLYEASIDAIRELGNSAAPRRILVIFSDGESEDEAFTLSEVVNEATSNSVQIIGLGSIRARSELGFTQTLERLGEETGGLFFNSPVGSGSFAPEDLGQIASFLGGGSTLSIPDAALQAGITQPLNLSLQYADGSAIQASFQLPEGAIPVPGAATPAPTTTDQANQPVTLAQGTPVTPGTQPVVVPTNTAFQETLLQRIERTIGFPAWWLAVGIGVIVVLLILILLLRRRGGRDDGPEGPGGQRPTAQPQAAPRPAAPLASARAAAQAATAVAPSAAPPTAVAGGNAAATTVAPSAAPATAVVPEPGPAATRRVAAGATKVVDAPAPAQTRAIRTTLGTLKKLPSDEMVKLYDQKVSLGRSETCTVTFDDDSVSRNHAEIEFGSDGTVMIKDLDSTNGVFVNDKKVTTSAITPSDKVRVGKAEFMILLPLASE